MSEFVYLWSKLISLNTYNCLSKNDRKKDFPFQLDKLRSYNWDYEKYPKLKLNIIAYANKLYCKNCSAVHWITWI